jgi:hypothetical protein
VYCFSCGSVYNSNPENTVCEVRWYVYLAAAVGVTTLVLVLTTLQLRFRFGNGQVSKLMGKGRALRRMKADGKWPWLVSLFGDDGEEDDDREEEEEEDNNEVRE